VTLRTKHSITYRLLTCFEQKRDNRASSAASCKNVLPEGNLCFFAAEAKAAVATNPRVRSPSTNQPSLADLLSGAMEGLDDELPAIASTLPAVQILPPAAKPRPQLSSKYVAEGAVAEGSRLAGVSQQSQGAAAPPLSSVVPRAAASLEGLQASGPQTLGLTENET
jgi:hypothetical protein